MDTPIPQTEITEQELNETIETIQKLDEVFGWFNRKHPDAPKPVKSNPSQSEINRKDMDDDIHDKSNTIHLDHFLNDAEIVDFFKIIGNVQNLKYLENKKECLQLIKKFKEIFDVIKIAFPFLKSRSREFGLVIPTLNETNLKDKIKTVFDN